MTSPRMTWLSGGNVGNSIPDPTSINLQEKLIKVPIQRQHPYESHISRFALFPTPCCPDDADTGVRAAVRPSTYPLVPVHPPHITVLSKTKGAPYRHEVHSLSREEALTWPGQHGFYHHPRSTESTNQGLYPTPPKAVHPNPTLWPWSTTLSERTARMLCNVERSHWVTSHQLDFTGCGPMNPLKLDDFHEKTVAVAAGADPHTVQLKERSHPVFTPSRPMAGHKQRIREGVIGGRLWSAPEHSGERPMTHSSFSGRLPCSSPTASPRGFMTPPSRSRSTLLELQDSFSKTEAHRQLQQATESSPVDLRDAIRTGKRRCFHGFHSYCFHT